MKSLMVLLQGVLLDAERWCCTSTTRDFKEISRRVEHEGISFLTITLPIFCRDFESCLDKGYVDNTTFLSFKKSRALPAFLRGLLCLVFDPTSGRLRDHPSHDAIFFIRQITLMFKKILLPCAEKRVKGAYDGYVACEKEVKDWTISVTDQEIDRFGRIADLVFAHDLTAIDLAIYSTRHVPRHGPGATAERITANGKYSITAWTQRLEENFFPAEQFVLANSSYFDELESVDFLEPDAEIPVRVITVPKTMKTPRIIAIEPVCMQYAQQSILEILVPCLEQSNYLHQAIGFTDQVPNQELARIGSENGSLATIDLSEASDRVSNLLVKRLFMNYPALASAVQACRSERADVPGKGIISLTKFASMGSALCFPVEAMVFLTIILCAYEKELSRTLKKEDVNDILQQVRVYGDDIIVPTDLVRLVCCELEAFGLKVNTNKSFWTGKFRESCGRDYYDGTDVTVTYVRRNISVRRGNASEIASTVSLRNQLYKAGLWNAVKALDNVLEGFASFPVVSETSPVLGRHSFLGYETQRLSEDTHSPQVKGYVLRPVPRQSKLDGHGALLKFFLKRGNQPFFDVKHLERYGRPEHVDINVRWASSF